MVGFSWACSNSRVLKNSIFCSVMFDATQIKNASRCTFGTPLQHLSSFSKVEHLVFFFEGTSFGIALRTKLGSVMQRNKAGAVRCHA